MKYRIDIEAAGLQIEAEDGRSLLEALVNAELFLRTDCGGKGHCGKCLVRVLKSTEGTLPQLDESELRYLSDSDIKAGYRLACRLIVTANLSLEIPETSRLSAEVAQKGSPILFERFKSAASPRPDAQARFGVAVDLGTTTIAVYLCELATAAVTASISVRNPQAIFGDDVMSRIGAVSIETDVLPRLQKMAVKAIEWGVNTICRSTRTERSAIDHMVVVGNTTMVHCFMGRDPSSIGMYPYEPVFKDQQVCRAESLGFRFNPATEVRTLPLITGFIGSDVVSAALAADLHQAPPGTMLVDVGTNGEVMLMGQDGLLATSCATGPAFEGAAIRHGMQAVSGAIDAVTLKSIDGNPDCSLIQKDPANPKPPAGLCGSGVISAVGELLRAGIIADSGAYDTSVDTPCWQKDDNDVPEFVLVPAAKSQNGRPITLSQGDVRAIQLAKGALRTGMDLLCREAGLQRPEKLLVAGAFGSFINKHDAVTIGMFPDMPQEKIEVVGNAAGAGAIMALFDPNCLQTIAEMTSATRVIELSKHPDFQNAFIDSLSFPEKKK